MAGTYQDGTVYFGDFFSKDNHAISTYMQLCIFPHDQNIYSIKYTVFRLLENPLCVHTPSCIITGGIWKLDIAEKHSRIMALKTAVVQDIYLHRNISQLCAEVTRLECMFCKWQVRLSEMFHGEQWYLTICKKYQICIWIINELVLTSLRLSFILLNVIVSENVSSIFSSNLIF